MNIHIIIVTYNGAEWIRKCIDSLLHSTVAVKIKVIDNLSTDDTVKILEKEYPAVDLLKSEINLGFGKANNLLMRNAMADGADYVFLLNQDAWVNEDTIAGLIDIQVRNPEYGIVSPMHLNGKGDSLDYNFARYCNEDDCPGILADIFLDRKKDVYPIDTVNAALWLMSRDCLTKVGLFDPVFPHYGEDTDYLRRVKKFNVKVGLSPKFCGYHDRDYRPSSVKRDRVIRHLSLLCELKDVNRSFMSAILFTIILSIKFTAEDLFKGKYEMAWTNITGLFTLLFKIPQVKRLRKICSVPGAYL